MQFVPAKPDQTMGLRVFTSEIGEAERVFGRQARLVPEMESEGEGLPCTVHIVSREQSFSPSIKDILLNFSEFYTTEN